MDTLPFFASINPMICLIVVLLPAPFNPINPTNSPAFTSNDTSFKTGVFVYPPVILLICNKEPITISFYLFFFVFKRKRYLLYCTKSFSSSHCFQFFRLIFPEYNRNIRTFYIGKKENKLLITTNHYKASYIWDEVSTAGIFQKTLL